MQQEEIVKLNDTSSMTTYRVRSPQTVYDVLKKLNLESKNFAVLVNGIKAEHSQVVDTEDQILVLPKIAGG
jgi:sulfur carrier protein ThiS